MTIISSSTRFSYLALDGDFLDFPLIFFSFTFTRKKSFEEQQLNTDKCLMIEQIFCHRHRRDIILIKLAAIVNSRGRDDDDKNLLFSEALFPLVSDDRTQHSSEARSQSFLLRQLSLNYECRCVNGIEYIWNYDASEGAIRLAESELGILFRTSNSFAESHGSLSVCWRHQHWLRMKFELFRRESENQLRMKSVEKAQFCFFG